MMMTLVLSSMSLSLPVSALAADAADARSLYYTQTFLSNVGVVVIHIDVYTRLMYIGPTYTIYKLHIHTVIISHSTRSGQTLGQKHKFHRKDW